MSSPTSLAGLGNLPVAAFGAVCVVIAEIITTLISIQFLKVTKSEGAYHRAKDSLQKTHE
jgi:hypothetical protein